MTDNSPQLTGREPGLPGEYARARERQAHTATFEGWISSIDMEVQPDHGSPAMTLTWLNTQYDSGQLTVLGDIMRKCRRPVRITIEEVEE